MKQDKKPASDQKSVGRTVVKVVLIVLFISMAGTCVMFSQGGPDYEGWMWLFILLLIIFLIVLLIFFLIVVSGAAIKRHRKNG